MFTETEIKIPINSEGQFNALLSLCDGLYPWQGTKIFQRDEYYDTPDESLKAADLALRIRYSDGVGKVALKGPRSYEANNVYSRIELEFAPASMVEVQGQIVRQQLICTAIVEKYRWKFKYEDIKITFDKIPFIGIFLEIEARTDVEIERILESLNLSAEGAIRENITELLEVKLKDLKLPLRPFLRATFEEEDKWQLEQSKDS